MNCCERSGDPSLGRRSVLKGVAAATGVLATSRLAFAQEGTRVRLAFCGQLLCVVPYEVTRALGYFRDEGLEVELVYTRGGNAAMQALVGGSVDYAGTSFDVALQAYSNGAQIRRFASTGRLPLFALATAPRRSGEITGLGDLEGRTVGVSALGNADHALMLYLLAQAGADARRVRFATIGTNLYDAVRLGQVDAGMVQEPALSLLVAQGARVLVNVMDLDDARRYLGGAYEFMGVAVRAEELEPRREEAARLARALARGLQATRTIPIEEVVAALPPALIAGGDRAQLLEILERYRQSLYPESVRIDRDAAGRVVAAHQEAALLPAGFDLGGLLDLTIVEG